LNVHKVKRLWLLLLLLLSSIGLH
jgi:hypothetical protein